MIEKIQKILEAMRRESASDCSDLRGLELQRLLAKKESLIFFYKKINKVIEEYEGEKTMTEQEREIGELLATTKTLSEEVKKLSEKIENISPSVAILLELVQEQKKILAQHSIEIKCLMLTSAVIITLVGGMEIIHGLLGKLR